ADISMCGEAERGNVGYRLDPKYPFGEHPFDPAAHRAFRNAELSRDAAIAAPGVALQKVNDRQVHLIDGVARLRLGQSARIAECRPPAVELENVKRQCAADGS